MNDSIAEDIEKLVQFVENLRFTDAIKIASPITEAADRVEVWLATYEPKEEETKFPF